MRRLLKKVPGLRYLLVELWKLHYRVTNWRQIRKARRELEEAERRRAAEARRVIDERINRARGQSDEVRILANLAKTAPRTFVEFGFEPSEFNCAALAWDPEWRGLLIDGNPASISNAKNYLPGHLQIVETFLTRENLGFIKQAFDKIGVLSIDVDGNDYWFLQELIDTKPAVISVEYNSTFGLEPVTVPYDPDFRRHDKHPSGWYHGASLTALAKLVAPHGYGLAAVSENGINAFFTKSGRLNPAKAWRPNSIRTASQTSQWDAVKHLPFVSV